MSSSDSAGLRQYAKAVSEFHEAIANLLALSSVEQDGWHDNVIQARPGSESDWAAAKARVDRSAPKAARAFAAVGVVVNWKPPGTWDTYAIDPATNWETVLGPNPRFTLDVLEACINQALGAIDDQISNPPPRKRQRAPRHWGPVVSWIAGVVGALIVAGIVYWLGWN